MQPCIIAFKIFLKIIEKKHNWSSIECAYILIGVEKFGIGNWEKIRKEYTDIFKERNSNNIRDKYRHILVLKKRKKIIFEKILETLNNIK